MAFAAEVNGGYIENYRKNLKTWDFSRTPDAVLDGLFDSPYASHYPVRGGRRIHCGDEGPKDAPLALLLKGEPAQSLFLCMMIPSLRVVGCRILAPYPIGFGRGD